MSFVYAILYGEEGVPIIWHTPLYQQKTHEMDNGSTYHKYATDNSITQWLQTVLGRFNHATGVVNIDYGLNIPTHHSVVQSKGYTNKKLYQNILIETNDQQLPVTIQTQTAYYKTRMMLLQCAVTNEISVWFTSFSLCDMTLCQWLRWRWKKNPLTQGAFGKYWLFLHSDKR